jgi:hypothetical protein
MKEITMDVLHDAANRLLFDHVGRRVPDAL